MIVQISEEEASNPGAFISFYVSNPKNWEMEV